MKRGKVLSLLLAAVAALFVSCESNRYEKLRSEHDRQDARSSWSADEGFKRLLAAKCFAFGGVGIIGSTSDGEFAFRAAMKSPNAAHLFMTACSEATDEGKLYALSGLRATDRDAFNHYVVMLREQNGSAETMSGCSLDKEPIRTVVQRIVNGDYDSYFAKR